MEEPAVVPEKISNPINYKIILMIVGAVTAIHLVINYGLDLERLDLVILLISVINPLVSGVTSVLIGFRYSMTYVFTRAYVLLGIGFICVGIGEVFYLLYENVFGINPFPSFADVFFLMFYPFVLVHLVINLKFFKLKYSRRNIGWLITFPIAYITTFSIFYEHVDTLETAITFGYVIPSSISLALAVVGANLFRKGTIGAAWFILLIGMISISSADVWYSYLEMAGDYSLEHSVNILWYVGYWVVTYALLKHKTAL